MAAACANETVAIFGKSTTLRRLLDLLRPTAGLARDGRLGELAHHIGALGGQRRLELTQTVDLPPPTGYPRLRNRQRRIHRR